MPALTLVLVAACIAIGFELGHLGAHPWGFAAAVASAWVALAVGYMTGAMMTFAG